MSVRTVEKRQYGGPFRGLMSTVERHEAPTTALTSDSRELLVKPGRVPELTKVVRRQGAASLGSAAGVLEMAIADATMRGQQVFEHSASCVADGYPLLGVLFGDESKRYGQIYLRDTNGPTDYTLGEDYSTTHYPVAASTVGNWKVVPIPYDGNGATGLTRLTYEDVRRRLHAGSRRVQGVRDWLYDGGFLSCPKRWNGQYNEASGAGADKMRIAPAGHCPPLWPPSFPAASYPTRKATAAPWREGDTFFASCMFEWEDGSFSMPVIPRAINSTLTGGRGLVVVNDDAAGADEYFDFIPWRSIPIGPHGVVRVWLLRTPKISKALIATGSYPAIGKLQITGFVPNGTTSYDDPNGNDEGLTNDTARVRYDHKWPERARYIWAFDQRVAMGYLRPNPCAIVLTCSGSAASRDLNGDDAANPGSVFFHFRVYSSGATLELHLRKTTGGVTTTTAITLSASVTLQNVVDSINATVFGGSGGEWAAQLVPGALGSLPSTYLALQSVDLACGTTNASPTVTSAALFADVAEGMRVTGTGIPAGAYVKSKASTSSLTLSANATATANPVTLTFAVDTGDGGIVSVTDTGNVRVYNGAHYGVIPFKQTYLDTVETSKRDFVITGGGPSHARSAANSYYIAVGNRSTVEAEAGVFMGGAPINDGCVLFYSKRIYWLRNQRSGGSGEDADYRTLPLESARGCKSPYTIVYGNGWAGCWTDDGFWSFDGKDTRIISGDVCDRDADGGFTGDLAYEAGQCAAVAAADGTDYRMFAHFRDGRLWLNYRTAANAYGTLCYDCSPSVESSGVAQLMRPDGQTYGWSARLSYSWRTASDTVSGPLGSVQKSDGVKLYAVDDRNDKTTCGLVQQFEVEGSYLDGVAPIVWKAALVTDMCGTTKKKSALNLTFIYKYTSASATTATVTIYTRHDRAASGTRVLARTTTGAFTRKVIELTPAMKSAAETLEVMLTGGTNADESVFELTMAEMAYEVLDSVN